MAAPVVTPLPTPPVRSDAPADFSSKADAFVASLPPMVTQLNASFVWIDGQTTDAAGSVAAAAASASLASTKRDEAVSAAAAAALSEGAAAASETAAELAANAASASESASSASASAAALSQAAAADSAVSAEASRDAAQGWAEQAEETVIGDTIADTIISNFQVRSSLNDSIGNFENLDITASTAITALQFGRITQTASAVTVTVPSAPSEGQMVMVGNLTSRLDHAVDVGLNKIKGQDPSGIFLIDRAFVTITLKYINAAYGWEVLQ